MLLIRSQPGKDSSNDAVNIVECPRANRNPNEQQCIEYDVRKPHLLSCFIYNKCAPPKMMMQQRGFFWPLSKVVKGHCYSLIICAIWVLKYYFRHKRNYRFFASRTLFIPYRKVFRYRRGGKTFAQIFLYFPLLPDSEPLLSPAA